MKTSIIAAIAALGLIATGASAQARMLHRHASCSSCGPLPTTVHVNLVHRTESYTRYHDRNVYQHLPRLHRIVTVTKIQPIVHVYDVTRVHHHKVYYVQNTYANETRYLRPLTYVHPSVRNTYDGGCGCGGY